ncbi:hypothetical protein BH11BAC3_BH11BAC3_32950 [soil metagenome]
MQVCRFKGCTPTPVKHLINSFFLVVSKLGGLTPLHVESINGVLIGVIPVELLKVIITCGRD